MSGDQVARDAQQVRVHDHHHDDTVTHDLRAYEWTPEFGRRFLTECDLTLAASAGAMFTTRPATCADCWERTRVRSDLTPTSRTER